ncbi:MAG: biotin-dependent carboxyltransferase family protein [Cytophagales bacterium]|nr:biotin-dependent carboxyltransferase family protein [Cytophagales bacterium]
MKLLTIKAGPLTTVQDQGRFAAAHLGFPPSGAMDQYHYRLANWLVGNVAEEPCLELTLSGGWWRAEGEVTAALCGAPMAMEVNGHSQPLNTSFRLESGDELRIGPCHQGWRAYLALGGAWDVPRPWGSASVHLASGVGERLRAGEGIAVGSRPSGPPRTLPGHLLRRVEAQRPCILRFASGPEWHHLTLTSQRYFQQQAYTLLPQSDRMGARFQAQEALATSGFEMLSSPVLPGIIQLPPSGQPIVLLRDAQTVGGYPRLGKVAEVDLNRLAQLRPGEEVRFLPIGWDEMARLKGWEERIFEALFGLGRPKG